MTETAPLIEHTGSCHCVRVRFSVRAPAQLEVSECNCSVCGIKSFYVPRSHPDGYSVNVRCLEPGTIASLRVRPFDGREWEAQYPKGRGELPI